MSNSDMPVTQQVERALPDGEYLELPEQWRHDLSKIVQRTESPSSIRSFLSCPLRWYLERYSDLPSEPTGFPGVVGTFAHRVLEVFYSEPQDLRDAKLLRRTFHNAWNAIKQSSGSGIIPPGLQEDFRILEENAGNPDGMRGSFYRKTRDAVMATLDFDDDPGDVKVLGTETWVKLKRHNVLVRGKVDRIVESRSGGESIQDYKTGRPPSEDEPVDVLSDTYVPVGLYALMRKLGNDSLGARAVANVQLLYLSNYLKYTIKVKPEVLEKTSSLLDRVIEMMNETVRTGTITVTPSESPSTGQCTWCPASGVCPVWTGSSSFDQMREELSI